MDYKALGAQLRAARENAGLKAGDVCKAAKIPNVQTLSIYERGVKAPSTATINALAKLYGVSPDAFLECLPGAQVQKAEVNYIRQLVEAATALNLPIFTSVDPFNEKKTQYLNLNFVPNDDFYLFVQKCVVLNQLHNDGVISREEYLQVVSERLKDIKL